MLCREDLNNRPKHVKRRMKRMPKKTVEDPKLRKEFETWFHTELKKSIQEDKEILKALD